MTINMDSFDGDTDDEKLATALAYAKSHGGGTVALPARDILGTAPWPPHSPPLPNEHAGGVHTYPPSKHWSADDGPTGWQAADGGGWIPGIFDTEETALAAAAVAWGPLMQEYAAMQARVNHLDQENRAITMADLNGLETPS